MEGRADSETSSKDFHQGSGGALGRSYEFLGKGERVTDNSDVNAEIPTFVYHYTTLENALEHILPSKRIRFGSLGQTNDPRETKYWLPSMGGAFNDPEPPPPGHIWQAITAYNQIRFNEWWAFCLSRDDPSLSADSKKQRTSYLQRGFARAAMWAHYGQDHRGICLEFDGQALNEAIASALGEGGSIFYGNVSYGDELNIPNIGPGESAFHFYHPHLIASGSIEDGVRAHILRHYRRVFLEKSADWCREFEFRWLVHSVSMPPAIDISKALRAVILGANFPSVYRPSARKLCSQLGASLECIKWENRIPIRQTCN